MERVDESRRREQGDKLLIVEKSIVLSSHLIMEIE